MKKIIIAGLTILMYSGAQAEIIQFGGDETTAPNVAGTDITLNLLSGAYTNYSHGTSGSIGDGVNEGVSWGDSVVTKGLEITITASSSIGPGNLNVQQNYLGVDGDGKVTYGESVSFSFNQDVRLVAFDAAYGSVRKYRLSSTELNIYNFTSTSPYLFSSDTILSKGDTLEFSGINGTPAVDVAATGLTVEAIPEPSTIFLFGLGGFGAWLLRQNKQKHNELQ